MINDIPNVEVSTAAPGQTKFTFSFRAFEEEAFFVQVDGAMATLTPDPSTALEFSLDTDFDVEGGEIDFGAPMAGGERLIIYRDLPVERVTGFPLTGPVSIQRINREFDRMVGLIQDLEEELQRAIRVNLGSNGLVVDTSGAQDGDTIIWESATQTFVVTPFLVNGSVLELRSVARAHVGTTPPDNPVNGDKWWKSDEGREKIYYDDGDTSQWVDAFPALENKIGFTELTPIFNFADLGKAYFWVPEDMELTVIDTQGTGTVVYAKSTAAAPDTFAATTSPISLEGGAWLEVECTAVTDYVAVAMKRTG